MKITIHPEVVSRIYATPSDLPDESGVLYVDADGDEFFTVRDSVGTIALQPITTGGVHAQLVDVNDDGDVTFPLTRMPVGTRMTFEQE